MVTPAATTREPVLERTPRFDPDTLPVETFDRTTSLRSDQWPESPTATMPPDFTPSPEAESILLQQLASPESSLTYLARVNGTTVDAISLWMARPDIMEKCRAIVTAGMMQTKMVVATRLNMCVKGLITIVAAAVEADAHTPAPIAFHDRRLREQQRRNSIRAVTLILRCGNYDPFTPTRTPRDRNAADPLPIAHSPLPSPPDPRLISNPKTWADLKDLIAQRDADRAATQREGDSSRVACLLEEQACSHDHTSSPTPDDLHGCATGCLRTSANNSESVPSHPHRTASVSERISDTLRDTQPSDDSPSSTLSLCHSVTPSPTPPPDPRFISNPRTWADLKNLIAQRDADRAATQRTPSRSDCSACATGCLPTSANNRESPSAPSPTPSHPQRTASVSERISSSSGLREQISSSDSSLPNPTLHAAGALRDLPLASSLKDDANSPSVALRGEPLSPGSAGSSSTSPSRDPP